MIAKRFLPYIYFSSFILILPVFLFIFGKEFYLTQLTTSLYYGILIIGLTLLMGFAGQISLGHSGFFAIGGYTTAFLSTLNISKLIESKNSLIVFLHEIGLTVSLTDIYGKSLIYINPFISFIIAIIITVFLSLLIGIPVLRLKGHYLSMATLGFGIILEKFVVGTKAFGEADGISNVPAFKLIGGLEITSSSYSKLMNYYIAFFFIIITLIVLINIINSRTGRALRSLHAGDEVTGAMGINPYKYKLMVFVISAILASISGIFLTHYSGGIGPSEAGFMKSIRYVAIVAAGGMTNFLGTLIMCIILNFISLRGWFGTYDDAVFGIILIVIMVFAPDGITKVFGNYIKDKFTFIFKKLKKSGS